MQDQLAADDSIMHDPNQSSIMHAEGNLTSRIGGDTIDTSTGPINIETSRGMEGNRTQRVRMRDRRGVYHSIDFAGSGKNKKEIIRSPSQQEAHELKMAEEKLKTIEMISRYREDKIKAEFKKLEDEL